MKHLWMIILVFAIACSSGSKDEKLTSDSTDSDIKTTQDEMSSEQQKMTEDEKFSYVIGFDIGEKMKADSINLSDTYFLRGLKDAMSNQNPEENLLSSKDRDATIQKFQNEQQERMEIERQKQMDSYNKLAASAKSDGEKFLASNKKRKDVETLPSGLQYRVIKKGTGEKPAKDGNVLMHIVAKFSDGTVFDDTKEYGPVKLPISMVIPGWQEAIPMMPVGSVWEIVLPPSLAYGEQGMEGRIPPHSTLIFEMQLIEIIKE